MREREREREEREEREKRERRERRKSFFLLLFCLVAENVFHFFFFSNCFDSIAILFEFSLNSFLFRTDGIGLAAPQVGLNVQVMVFNPTGEASVPEEEVVLVNPRILNRSKGQTLFEEGCLSLPNIHGDIKVRRKKESRRRKKTEED